MRSAFDERRENVFTVRLGAALRRLREQRRRCARLPQEEFEVPERLAQHAGTASAAAMDDLGRQDVVAARLTRFFLELLRFHETDALTPPNRSRT
jgi:hypothetical protein